MILYGQYDYCLILFLKKKNVTPISDFLTVSKVMGKMWSSQTEREKKVSTVRGDVNILILCA